MRWVVLTLIAGTLLMASGTSALAESQTFGQTFYVPATSGGETEAMAGTPWLDTGITVQAGMPVIVTAAGSWSSLCDAKRCRERPDGEGVLQLDECTFIAPDLSAGSLIARVGDGPAVFVGAGPTVVWGEGTLQFAINDCYFGDNKGGFMVTVYGGYGGQ